MEAAIANPATRLASICAAAMVIGCGHLAPGVGSRPPWPTGGAAAEEEHRAREERCLQGQGSSGALPFSLVPDPRRRCWYSGHLDAVEERPLREAIADGGEAYRFLWLRTFHRPVMIRVVARNGQIVLDAKETDGTGGYAPGGLSRTERRILSSTEWNVVLAAVDVSGLWSGDAGETSACLDGSQWILEGVRGTEHRLLDIQGCAANTELTAPRPPAYRPGEVLMQLARIRAPADETY